ncbi:MAG: hypothetical protein HA488_01965 [Candidatus Verstraetearchaeota archaeon]|jgi:hypothetical protein|nr:hypothetical protein [Candidatus Verstraetearchaeota archaeon]
MFKLKKLMEGASILQKIFRLIENAFPFICLFLFVLFLSGFTSTLLSPTIGLFPTSSGYSFIIPQMDYQTVVEFVMVFFLVSLSSLGVILMLYGSRISVDKRFSNVVILSGAFLFLLMIILLQYLLSIKLGLI